MAFFIFQYKLKLSPAYSPQDMSEAISEVSSSRAHSNLLLDSDNWRGLTAIMSILIDGSLGPDCNQNDYFPE